jgi:hypothetical protein
MLGYVLVVLIAVGAGYGVYSLAMQVGAPPPKTRDVDDWKGAGTRFPQPDSEDASVQPGYAPVAPPDAPSWHSRLNGTLGLVLAVSLAALTLAIAIYQVGHLIVRLMSQAAKS